MRAHPPMVLLLTLITASFWSCSDDSTSPGSLTVQDRVDAANAGDTVFLAPGVYTDLHEFTDPLGRTQLVFCEVKPGVLVQGATGDPADVIIDPGGVGRGFWFAQAGDSTGLAAVTVRNATWGISGWESSPRIDNCVLEDNGDTDANQFAAGTGMYFDSSNSVVSHCVFRGNESAGGAAAFSSGSDVRLQDCTFVGNRATGSGGGLTIGQHSSARVVDCTFTGNVAAGRGGGLHAGGDSLAVTGGVISDNTAGTSGGGVALDSGITGRFDRAAILENTAPEGAQGYVGDYSGEVRVVCCDTDAAGWVGKVIFEDEGCD